MLLVIVSWALHQSINHGKIFSNGFRKDHLLYILGLGAWYGNFSHFNYKSFLWAYLWLVTSFAVNLALLYGFYGVHYHYSLGIYTFLEDQTFISCKWHMMGFLQARIYLLLLPLKTWHIWCLSWHNVFLCMTHMMPELAQCSFVHCMFGL